MSKPPVDPNYLTRWIEACPIFWQSVPTMLNGGQWRCRRCGCSVPQSHVPGSDDCQQAGIERSISQSDWND
jgi:hypothetical protein